MIPLRLASHAADIDRDAGLLQTRDALSRDAGIGVAGRHDDAGDTGGHQRVSAGRRLARMGTGFQRHIGGRPRGLGPGLRQRLRLCMGSATDGGPPAPDDPPLFDDDAAHGRIGPDLAQTAPPQSQRVAHEVPVCLVGHVSDLVSGRSSLTNLSKSSAAWKFL